MEQNPKPTNPVETDYQHVRRYIRNGGRFGNICFVLYGAFFGFYIGGFSGAKFFEELFLVDLTGPVASILGSVIGVVIGLLSVWAIMVITGAFWAAVIFFVIYRFFPSPE